MRWRLSFVPLFVLAGCASPYAVPDAATAIAMGKKLCGNHNPKTWDAELVGDTWTVHGRDIDSRLFAEQTLVISRDGLRKPGCGLIPKPGIKIEP